jgi:hypothetical protein
MESARTPESPEFAVPEADPEMQSIPVPSNDTFFSVVAVNGLSSVDTAFRWQYAS